MTYIVLYMYSIALYLSHFFIKLKEKPCFKSLNEPIHMYETKG